MDEQLENGGSEGSADVSAPREEGFKGRMIRGLFEGLMRSQGNAPGRDRFMALGQSHLDAAWCWRVFQTRSKAKYTFRNALRHIDQHDFFTFSQSTPQFYEWMKDRQPRIFRAIQDAVKKGKWEIVGGMWVEPDCNMPDGESLVRQRLYGQRFYLDHFGRVSEIEWAPDSFGFAWTLPQIFAKSGTKYFWTTKLLWNDTNKFPLRSFLWQSPDGSQVLTHLSPFFGIDPQDFFRRMSRNRPVRRGEHLVADYSTSLKKIKDSLDKEPIPEVLIAYGMGDGGGGPNEFEIGTVRELMKSNTIETGTATEFFSRLETYRDRLPVWNDELYLEYHRGCYTTHGRVKRSNRRLEVALRVTEMIHSMNSLLGDIYPEEELREGWKTLLLHQFHDILPGSSIPEVYEDAYEEYERLEAMCEELGRNGLHNIARRINTKCDALPDCGPLIVYNPLSWKRTGIVRLEAPPNRTFRVFKADGALVPSQAYTWGDRCYVAFIAGNVPDMGYRTYYLKEEKIERPAPAETTEAAQAMDEMASTDGMDAMDGAAENATDDTTDIATDKAINDATDEEGAAVTTETFIPAPAYTDPLPADYHPVTVTRKDDGSVVLCNEFVKVTVDGVTGWISSIIDKVNQREMLDGPANELKLYRDSTLIYPAWNIDPHYKSKEIKIPKEPEGIEIIDNGPVLGTVVIKRQLRRSAVSQEVRLFADRPMVYLVTAVDWQETKALLKVSFQTAIKSDEVTADIPFGAISRATRPINNWDRGRWEMCCQKWISMSDGRYGIALLNDGKYGFSADGGTLALSLLRGPLYPAAIVNAWGLSEPIADRPKYTDQGRHVMRYAIMPHSGTWKSTGVWRAGQEFNAPLLAVRTGHHEGLMPPENTSLSCESETTYIAAIKRPEDYPGRADARYHQLVVRLVEAAGSEDKVRINFMGPNLMIADVREMDLLEFGSQPVGAVEAGAVTLDMKPFEIKTIKVTLTVRPGQ